MAWLIWPLNVFIPSEFKALTFYSMFAVHLHIYNWNVLFCINYADLFVVPGWFVSSDLDLDKWRHVFLDSVFNPVVESGNTCVDAWESWPRASVPGRDNSSQNPLVVVIANHGAAWVILQRNKTYFIISLILKYWVYMHPHEESSLQQTQTKL